MRLAHITATTAVLTLALFGSVASVTTPRALAYAPRPPTQGALYHDGQTGRYLLGGTWLYRADRGNVGERTRWWRNVASTAGWSPVAIPNSFNAGDFSLASMNGTVGWYRRDFLAPAGAFARGVPLNARRWIVRFELVNYRAAVWLNGHRIGRHVGALLPFEFELRGVRRGVNRLIVRVDNRRLPGEPPPGPGEGWWNYGGILSDVYLRAVAGVDIAQAHVTPLLRCPRCAARIEERVLLRNLTNGPQVVRLKGSFGTAPVNFGGVKIAPHATRLARAALRIARPRLWSPDHPALYRAQLTLTDARGRNLGGYRTDSGIRSITVTHDGRLELNGRLLHLRGAEVREQDLRLGAALDSSHLRQLFDRVRALGATVIRSDPLNPLIEEMADRTGILIWSDIPVTAQVLERRAWVSQGEALIRDNIAANRNHPSVLLWGVANELPTPSTSAEASYVASVSRLAHSLDPTRPVGMATQDWPGVGCQKAYAPLDVIGVNEYFGWYDAGGGTTDDRSLLSPFLDSLRACYPTKALFVTEFGFESNRSGPVEEHGTYAFQANSAAYHLGVFASKPWLSGAIYSLLQDSASGPDFAGGNPWPNPPFDHKGLLDLLGNPKPAWQVVSSIYRSTREIAPARRPRLRR